MQTCDRCKEETRITLMSIFNTEIICQECIWKEKAHPDYDKAREAEMEACRNGDRNFPGIGKPEDL